MAKSLELHKPHLLVVVGVPGSGKTFFAKQFGDAFGAPFIDYYYYHSLVKDADMGDIVATDLIGKLLMTNQTVIIEGRGESKQDRQILAQLAAANGYEVLYIWVQTEPQTAKKRVTSSNNPVYSEREYAERAAGFVSPDKPEPFIVISGKHTFPSQAKNVLKNLTVKRASATHIPQTPNRTPIQNHTGRIIIR